MEEEEEEESLKENIKKKGENRKLATRFPVES
jgi:hypothetical protein